MTFSIVARSEDRTMFGVAVASSSPAVAARCAHARSGVGAAATQNVTDPALGPQILRSLATAASANEALDEVVRATPYAAYRQLLVVGATGIPAIHSGTQALGLVGAMRGIDAAAAGNMLAHRDVPAAMVETFAATGGQFGHRLLCAMRAGLERGGEAGPIHSAGLMIVRDVSWPIVDLRVDWSDADPITALASIWEIYAPQIDVYVQRAIDPSQAPTFGVPGDP